MSRDKKPQVPGESDPAPRKKAGARGAESDLPDAKDIDQAKLTAPKLTKQGWLLPA